MNQLNVFGQPLLSCCYDPLTGFFRDGFCNTNQQDSGTHIICALMTDSFLVFSRDKGNDLITPVPEFNFPGLVKGDYWCICVLRWIEAYENQMAPRIKLASTNKLALDYVDLELLKEFAIDVN